MPNTRTKSPQARLQSGQAIVLIALLILVLFGMLGLAIDSGRAYVDRRDQQAAVDAAALAAGDWYENYHDLYGYSIPYSVQLYQNDMRLYGATPAPTHSYTLVGPNNNLPQDTYQYIWAAAGYELDIVATNTQFNGYDFTYTTTHALPLAFMQIFGGPTKATITATATAVVGDQRQTPALLTLSSDACALTLTGSADLTVLGDTYTNGSACVDANLHEAGNCYGGAGSNCNAAQYYCYNATPGFIPYPPPCNPGDTVGQAVVPAPALPDPGYLAPSVPYYSGAIGTYNQNNHGTYTEMQPGTYGGFHLSGGSASCAFLDPGVYIWSSGYTSDATGSLLSNELKAPDEEDSAAPGTSSVANPQFWDMNSTGCAGHFSVAVNIAAGYGIKKGGLGNGTWGVELTSVRYDTFADPTILPDPCLVSPGCYRESTPSHCVQVNTTDVKDQVIDVSITQNAPGAQYYNVYVDPNGCENNSANFSFINRYLAPGWTDGGGPPAFWTGGAYPNGGAGIVLKNGTGGWPCLAVGHTICKVTALGLAGNSSCWAQLHGTGCQAPDDELAPQCFSNCPPPAGLLSQENPPMALQYGGYTGGDEANENTCRLSANPGDPNAPCNTAKITPGAVQFYFPNGSCMTQNAQGATYVFSGEQYNWIIIYQVPGSACADTLNGGASTQYIGTIYTPSADWKINGGDRSPLAGQVISYTATLKGAAAVGIDFNPNYAPAPPAARLIN